VKKGRPRNRSDDLLEIIRVEIKRQAAVADPVLMTAFKMTPGVAKQECARR